MSSGRLRGVDAARGLAAGLVFVHHLDVLFPSGFMNLLGNSVCTTVLKALSARNSDAVMLFFVISGFCIRATSRRYDFQRRDDLVQYAWRRVFRIVPLYLIAIALTFGVGAALGTTSDQAFSVETLLGNLAFLQTAAETRGNWFVPYGNNAPLWSLSYEAFYYVIFPFAFLLEAKLPARVGTNRSLAGLSATFMVSCLALLLYQAIPNPIFSFLTLYGVWRLGVSMDDMRQKEAPRIGLVFVLLVLVVLLTVADLLRESATLQVMASGAVLGLLWIVIQSDAVSWVLRIKPIAMLIDCLAWIGGFSYALYLLHYPLIELVKNVLTDDTAGIVIAILASLAVAFAAEWLANWIKQQLLYVAVKPA
jgi:peptidoglycan/LPS O-acetylase OafA/YrhL